MYLPSQRGARRLTKLGRVLLLKRTDVDTSLKDFEGYTAFDLYNSTLRTTKPSHLGDVSAELFTWGANRYVINSLPIVIPVVMCNT